MGWTRECDSRDGLLPLGTRWSSGWYEWRTALRCCDLLRHCIDCSDNQARFTNRSDWNGCAVSLPKLYARLPALRHRGAGIFYCGRRSHARSWIVFRIAFRIESSAAATVRTRAPDSDAAATTASKNFGVHP